MVESTFSSLLLGMDQVFTGYNLLYVVIAAFIGTCVGMLPGIGPATGLALLLPFIYGMDPVSAIIILGGVYFGANYGGSISSILINTPGDASSVISSIEGHPMAMNGRAGAALFISALASFIGGMTALVAVAFLAIPLTRVALSFGPAEYAALMVFALVATSTLFESARIKGLISCILGLMIATIGIDLQSGSSRFTFGQPELMDGIHLLVVIIGLFCISEAFLNIEKLRDATWQNPALIGRLWVSKAEWLQSRWALVRGTLTGFWVGIFPGAGGAVATAFAYAWERRITKTPERFTKGAIEGLAGPEASNNAAAGGALMPLLTLGIPGSASTAIMLSAMMMYGIQPGPQLLFEEAALTWGLLASLIIGNFVLLFINIPMIGMWVKVLQIPGAVLTSAIMLLAFTGAYSLNNSLFDVWLVLGFGALGYVMKKTGFPLVPMVLGVILGPILEQSARQTLMLARNDWSVFVTRPISATLLALSVIVILLPLTLTFVRSLRRRTRPA